MVALLIAHNFAPVLLCQGVHPLDLARGFEEDFWADMAVLNVRPPTVVTRVTEHIPDILKYVDDIVSNGYGYAPAGGDGVYFDTKAFESRHAYGKLGNSGTEPSTDTPASTVKRDSRDFALWKCSSESQAGEWSWQSQWGAGRPGWHIECSTMIHAVFGKHIDVHGGGIDLKCVMIRCWF